MDVTRYQFSFDFHLDWKSFCQIQRMNELEAKNVTKCAKRANCFHAVLPCIYLISVLADKT